MSLNTKRYSEGLTKKERARRQKDVEQRHRLGVPRILRYVVRESEAREVAAGVAVSAFERRGGKSFKRWLRDVVTVGALVGSQKKSHQRALAKELRS